MLLLAEHTCIQVSCDNKSGKKTIYRYIHFLLPLMTALEICDVQLPMNKLC